MKNTFVLTSKIPQAGYTEDGHADAMRSTKPGIN